MKIEPALLARCDEVLTTGAPETREVPRYIVSADELHGLPIGDHVFGWAYCDWIFDRNVIDRLGDRYRGPGILICLDLKKIAAAANPGQFERCVLNTVAHEGAHVVPIREMDEPSDTPRVRVLQLDRMAKGFAQPAPNPGAVDDYHDWRFIRRACHFYFRNRMAGIDICADRLFGPQDWLAQTLVYVDALLVELVKLSESTFEEIERTAAPHAFTAQWESDLKFYNEVFSKR